MPKSNRHLSHLRSKFFVLAPRNRQTVFKNKSEKNFDSKYFQHGNMKPYDGYGDVWGFADHALSRSKKVTGKGIARNGKGG